MRETINRRRRRTQPRRVCFPLPPPPLGRRCSFPILSGARRLAGALEPCCRVGNVAPGSNFYQTFNSNPSACRAIIDLVCTYERELICVSLTQIVKPVSHEPGSICPRWHAAMRDKNCITWQRPGALHKDTMFSTPRQKRHSNTRHSNENIVG